ncbi:MAG: cytochrome c biogenesis protein [Candidatus Thermoplasmatota archaeon]|nr:cytochrome c biogenesis protein [Candidatus Thermoplasmatota archaeon]
MKSLTMNNRYFCLIVIAMTIASALFVTPTSAQQSENNAPDFTTTDLNGTAFSLHDFSGDVVVLHFMKIDEDGEINTTNKQQITDLKTVWETTTGNLSIITIVSAANASTNITQFRDSHSITWWFTVDNQVYELYSNFTQAWGDPTILLLDRNLNIFEGYSYIDAQTLSMKIEILKKEETVVHYEKAPNFTLQDANGTTFSLHNFKTKIVVLHFMQFGCGGQAGVNEQQFNEFKSLLNQYPEVVIITVFVSSCSFDLMEAKQNYGITWWFANDEQWDAIKHYWDYGLDENGIFQNPTLFLVDKEQNLRKKFSGVTSADVLSSNITVLLEGGELESGLGKEKEFLLLEQSIVFFGLGIVTSLSPCSIVLLISMISYVASVSKVEVETIDKDSKKWRRMKKRERRREELREKDEIRKKSLLHGLILGLMFTFGMAIVFFLVGCLIAFFGIFLPQLVIVNLIAGIILVVLGINIIKPLKNLIPIKRLFKPKEQGGESCKTTLRGQTWVQKIAKRSPLLGALFLGILFSFAWAPCAVPLIFPVLIMVMMQKIPILVGGLLLFIFGLGHGIPVIPLSVASTSAKAEIGKKYVSVGKWTTKIFGVIIIVIGVLMALRYYGIILW